MTTKLKLKTYLLIVFSFVLLVVPAISLATFIPLGTPCTPDVLPLATGEWWGVGARCLKARNQGLDSLHLKWDLQASYKDPVCYIDIYVPGDSFYRVFTRNDENIVSFDPGNRADFKPKDDVIFTSRYPGFLLPGAKYNVFCHERDIPGVKKFTTRMEIVEVEPCEVGYQKILNDLANGTKTTVTEENFYNWTSPDLKDNNTLSMGLGSGDKMDVIMTMDGMQSCQKLPNPADPDYYSVKMTGYDNVISTIKNSVDNYDPIMIGIVTKKADIGHALLVLSFKTTSDPRKPVVMEAFDSNNTNMTISLTCKKEQDLIPGQGYYYFLSCQLPARLTDYRVFIPLTLNSQRVDCGILNRVRPQPTNWLAKSGNTPSFENSTTTNNTKGICYGYSEFVRNVACFGDFSGTDYHPGDGKYVGKDCDASHNIILTNRLQPKKTNNLLANIYRAFSALLPF